MKNKPAEGYQSTFSHDDETASAGYYKVKLQKSGVTTELRLEDKYNLSEGEAFVTGVQPS